MSIAEWEQSAIAYHSLPKLEREHSDMRRRLARRPDMKGCKCAGCQNGIAARKAADAEAREGRA